MTASRPQPTVESVPEAPPAAAAPAAPGPTNHPGLDLAGYADGPAAEAWALAMRLFFLRSKPRYVAVGKELDLSPPQGQVLGMLAEPRPMGELASLMHCDSSNVTGIVDRLSERGLVERRASEHDRRVKLIALTGAGEGLRERLSRAMAQPPDELTALPEADQIALRDILRRAFGAAE